MRRRGFDPIAKQSNSTRLFGPGLIMAASGIGASDMIAATVSGATCGRTLLWALLLAAFFKFILSEGIARWQLATGTTVMEGWAKYLPRWVLILFAIYLVVWAMGVSGALVSGCGLAVENITGGKVSRSWGGFAQAAIAFVLIYFARTKSITYVMKPMIALMFIGIVLCAILTFREPFAVLQGLFLPTILPGKTSYVFSLIGGIGGSLTLLSYNYLLSSEDKVDPKYLRFVRRDLLLAYFFTAIFGLSTMLMAHQVFFVPGIEISDQDVVSRMALQLSAILGPFGFYVYSIGFWAAVVASLVGVWQTIPNVLVDCYGLLRRMNRENRESAMKIGSPQFRIALLFMALVAVPFAFNNHPLLIVVAFTILGSIFVPFLTLTLLYLNNCVQWTTHVSRNRISSNLVLALILLIFLMITILEVKTLFKA